MAGCCSVEGTLDGSEVMAIIQVRDGVSWMKTVGIRRREVFRTSSEAGSQFHGIWSLGGGGGGNKQGEKE